MSLANIHPDALNAFIYGDHGAPGEILGAHPETDDSGIARISLRAMRPNARKLSVVDEDSGTHYPMRRVRDEGLFEVSIPADIETLRYHFHAVTYEGVEERIDDAYDLRRFPFLLTDYDLYLYGEGKLVYSYEKLGAHIREIDGVSGVNFAVWAPTAKRMSVVGSFNGWDARIHSMFPRTGGIWEIFIPDAKEWDIYRYDVRSHHMGYSARKSDPYSFYGELRPANASIVVDIDRYAWEDAAWMEQRADTNPLTQPISIYEVHLGSWRHGEGDTWLNYRELAHQLVDYAKDMGYSHLEVLPIMEHPYDGSWGYQVTGYYAPTSRYGTPEDFMYFVDYCHQNGIGVILDWVPAHFPKDGFALSYFDGSHLYSHADPRKGEHPDWGTYIFNYGRNEVRNFLTSNALFWTKQYHIDGLRVDAVSSIIFLNFSREDGEWEPNPFGGNENLDALGFLREMNEIVHREAPGAYTIAEEASSYPNISRPTYLGGLGFTFKWDMGWMHDTLDYMELDPVYRREHHLLITFSMMYAFKENYIMPLSHDEVVHLKGSMLTKMPGDWWQKFASLRLTFAYMIAHPGKKLHFMGQEFGQWSEWDEKRALDWYLLDWDTHAGMQRWMRDLNHFYRAHPAFWQRDQDWSGFEWSVVEDANNSVFAFARLAQERDDFVVVALNFTPVPRYGYPIGVPKPGRYHETLNSDAGKYGGGGVINSGDLEAVPVEGAKMPYQIYLTLPPLGALFLEWERPPAESEMIEKRILESGDNTMTNDPKPSTGDQEMKTQNPAEGTPEVTDEKPGLDPSGVLKKERASISSTGEGASQEPKTEDPAEGAREPDHNSETGADPSSAAENADKK